MRETQSQSRGPRFLHTHIFSCSLAAGEMVKLETKNSIPHIALIRAATTAKNVGSEEEEIREICDSYWDRSRADASDFSS